jgi:hypothetical protein
MKLLWKEHQSRPLHLVAYAPEVTDANDPNYVNFLTEQDLLLVWQWCAANDCGVRTSFDTFRFRNKKQITMFLLRWT